MGYQMSKVNLLHDNIIREFRTPAIYMAVLLGFLGLVWYLRFG